MYSTARKRAGRGWYAWRWLRAGSLLEHHEWRPLLHGRCKPVFRRGRVGTARYVGQGRHREQLTGRFEESRHALAVPTGTPVAAARVVARYQHRLVREVGLLESRYRQGVARC
jgi:hypothetical protein